LTTHVTAFALVMR